MLALAGMRQAVTGAFLIPASAARAASRAAYWAWTDRARFEGPLVLRQMAIYNSKMDISVTEFRHRCLEIIRSVEKTGKPVAITRRGRVVAQLEPPLPEGDATGAKPWERLRGRAKWLAEPEETFVSEADLKGL